MSEYLTLLKDWVIELGEKHNVDPLLLGSLYLVSKISLIVFLGLVVKNVRAKKSVVIPVLFAALSFCVPYVYLIIAGRNISVWVYVFIGLVLVYGGYTIRKKIIEKPEPLKT